MNDRAERPVRATVSTIGCGVRRVVVALAAALGTLTFAPALVSAPAPLSSPAPLSAPAPLSSPTSAIGIGTLLRMSGGLLAQSAPPHHDYRTFSTPHFEVVYADGLREVALRTAAHAERAYEVLTAEFLPGADETIELLVTDHTDRSNGFADASPRPRITLWVRPPMDATALSHFDDWLGFLTMHELTHVLHLDRTGTIGRVLRRFVGRPPHAWPFFQGHLLPQWGVEGIAVHAESEHTGAGRLHGTFHASTVRAEALGGELETLGQALGRSPDWPGGDRPYVYGSLFIGWLDETYGAGTARDFLDDATTQWIPFRLDAPARAATGSSLGELWEDWREEVESEARARGASAPQELELLTRGARNAAHPAAHPGGDGVVYVRADGRSDTRIVHRDREGAERTVSRWNEVGRAVWTREGDLLATQPEYLDRWHFVRDLHRVSLDGSSTRITHGMRLSHVDENPATGAVVAVQEGGGTNRLLVLDAGGAVEEVLVDRDPGVHWAYPRWSPDGSVLAAVRWRQGGRSGIVLVGGDGRARVVAEDGALHTSPAWSPDGRWILWASDRDGTLDVYARRVVDGRPAGPLRQVTGSPTGATQPSVDPAGEWIYVSTLGADGWDVARIPFDTASWWEPASIEPRFIVPASSDGGTSGGLEGGGPPTPQIVEEDRPWTPFPGLLPAYWLPIVREGEQVADHRVLEPGLGFETSGEDILSRHRWRVEAALPVSGPRRLAATGRWRWAGLGQPVLVLSGGQRYRTAGRIIPPGEDEEPLFPVTRSRSVALDAEVTRRRARSRIVVTAGVGEVRESTNLFDREGAASDRFTLIRPERSLSEFRGAVTLSTARAHAFSVSAEEGVLLSLQGRRRWDRDVPESLRARPGMDGTFDQGIVVARGFRPFELPGPFPDFARGVVGVRAAAGIAGGPGAGRSHFRVGGGGGGPDVWGGFAWTSGMPLFGVRGVPRGVVAGDRAWAAGAEIRLPVGMLHWGWGALPLHLDRVAASIFADAAGAGRPAEEGGGRVWDWRSAVGVEATVSGTVLFRDSGRLRAGAALPTRPDSSPVVYLRAGWAF